MARSTVSPEAKATRRRALGRRLAQKSSQLSVDLEALRGSPDLQFLSPAESKAMEKQFSALDAVRKNFSRVGVKLEKS